MERHLGLSYPTVRARLEEAFDAAGLVRGSVETKSRKQRRMEVLKQLQVGSISASEATQQLRQIKERR
jgi:hypothetical protein